MPSTAMMVMAVCTERLAMVDSITSKDRTATKIASARMDTPERSFSGTKNVGTTRANMHVTSGIRLGAAGPRSNTTERIVKPAIPQ